jgi:hypothetical protein
MKLSMSEVAAKLVARGYFPVGKAEEAMRRQLAEIYIDVRCLNQYKQTKKENAMVKVLYDSDPMKREEMEENLTVEEWEELYEGLCAKVEAVDTAAAKYMREDIRTSGISFAPSDILDECFMWLLTPQGHLYWRDIAEKIGQWAPKETEETND